MIRSAASPEGWNEAPRLEVGRESRSSGARRWWIAIRAGGVLLAAALTLGCAQDGEAEETPVEPRVTVSVGAVVRATLHEHIDRWGTVEPQPATENLPPAAARVSAAVPGILTETLCAEGAKVKRGDLLFRLDARLADIAVARARQAVDLAQQAFDRQVEMGSGEATSRRQYQEAEGALRTARSELADAETQRALLDVRAPLSGTVVTVTAKPGESVDPSAGLAEIIDLTRLVVTVAVPSADVARVKSGQAARIAARGGSGEWPSEVVFVGARVDRSTDAVIVRLSVPRDSGLRPGQFVNVRILTGEHVDCLAVPAESVVTEDGHPALAIVEGEVATKRPVRTGITDGPLVEVEGEGLREGMTVVTEGAYGLPHESRIVVKQP